MYTILVTDDNELRVTTKERIMQRSKMVDAFHFLVKPKYKDTIDMTGFTVTMEYKLPVSNEYVTKDISEDLVLTVDEEGNTVLYKEMLEYKLPFDTNLTAEAGEVEVQLTFTKSEMDTEGVVTQYVRKTSPCKITIVPIAAWSNVIPDKALTALDQRILKVDEQIKALSDSAMLLVQDKADNIKLDTDTHEIYLTANGEPIGDRITIDELGDTLVDVHEDEGLVKVII
jgi:hypothetical protein